MPRARAEPPAKVWKRPSAPRNGWKYFICSEAQRKYERVLSGKGSSLIERNVAIDQLHSIGIGAQFAQRGWISACSGYIPSHPEMVKEFLVNVVSAHPEHLTFTSCTRGKEIIFSVDAIREMLDLPVVVGAQWPLPATEQPAPDEIYREMSGGVFNEMEKIKLSFLVPQYRILFKILCSFIEPSGHTSDVTLSQAYLLYGIGRGYSFDLAVKIWTDVYDYILHPPGTSAIPFSSVITRFLLAHKVHLTPDEPSVPLPPPITYRTLDNSKYDISIPDDYDVPFSPLLPRYPRTTAVFSPLHTPPGFKFPWDRIVIGASTSSSLPASAPSTERDTNLLAVITSEFAALHSKIDGTAAAISALGDRLSAVESRLEALDFCAHVRATIVDEMTKSLDALAGCTRKYVSRYGTDPVPGVGNDNVINLGADGDTPMPDG
ncbi:hypothetical protein Vadar_031322 [Vaccinium darrowii]|uniref:Uncharacterized protein n=1 Tax=Vaccinium darrowii TaxID=229202 RepID=A0ACB7ZNT8_9ERIC|nr:hypothetical protein Vadar_031322 [Vaccinium darrowii]